MLTSEAAIVGVGAFAYAQTLKSNEKLNDNCTSCSHLHTLLDFEAACPLHVTLFAMIS